MAQPDGNSLRPIDPVLTDLSIGYKNEMFMWDQLAPVVSQNEKSGTYFKYTRDYWFRRQEGAERAPGGQYLRTGYGVETDTYRTIELGFEKALDDSDKASSQTPESLDTLDTLFLTNLMQLELEKRVSSELFVANIWGTTRTLSGSDKWSDYAASDPIEDADTAVRTIRRATGVLRNSVSLFMGSVGWDSLKNHPLILDKYKHTQTGIMTPQLVAAVLDIKEIVIGESVENTAVEGLTFSGADVWTDNGLFYVKNNQALSVANGAYTYIWNERGNVPWAVENYREESIRSDVNRIFTHFDVEVVSPEHGYMLVDLA